MQDPGFSVFQGTSVHVNNLSTDDEEEEHDKKRRYDEVQEELEKMMENETMDESEYASHNGSGGGNNWREKNHVSPAKFAFMATGDGISTASEEKDGLRTALEIRCQEVIQLQTTLSKERHAHEVEMKKMEKYIAIANAEKERAIMTREQNHELLVESKAKSSELESTIMRLQRNIEELKKENSELVVDIENTNRMLKDSEMKRQIAENTAHRGRDQLREVEKKNAEVEMLQERVNCLQNKVFDKENEMKTFEKKYRELERNREALLRDKTETINDLMRSLSEAQGQCNELLSRPDLTHENFQLRQEVRSYQKQSEDMQKRINHLTLQLDSTNRDLQLFGNMSGDLEMKFLDSDHKLQSSTPISTNHTIRDELCRALANVKEKREEIQKLQEEIQTKNREIETLRETENDSLIKINEYKDEILKLTKKLRLHDNQCKENHEICQGCEELKRQLITMPQENSETEQNLLREAQIEIEKLKNQYCSLSADKNNLLREINELKTQDFVQNIEQLQTECQSLRQNLHECQELIKKKEHEINKEKWEHREEIDKLKEVYEKEKSMNITKHHRSMRSDSHDCNDCLNQMTEITRQEIDNIQLQKDCANYLREISHLRAELKESTATVNDLHARLGLKEEQNRVIADLKEQAAKFGEYIKNCSASTTPQKVDSRDASVSTSPDMDGHSNPALYDQYAEEINKLEKQYRDKEMRAQEAMKKLIAHRDEMHREFQENINILKMVIFSERKEHERLIEEKEMEMAQTAEQHREIAEKYKQDLNGLRRQIEELQVMVKELRRENETEKNAVMNLMTQWNCEKENVRVREVELQGLIEEIKKKYESAKTRAQNYKKYSEEHEAHMKKEYNRIKQTYETYKAQVEDRIQALKEEYDKITEKKITKIEEQYIQKLAGLRKI